MSVQTNNKTRCNRKLLIRTVKHKKGRRVINVYNFSDVNKRKCIMFMKLLLQIGTGKRKSWINK